MEVFDRTSEYDPNIDAIVRVEQRHAWICTKQRRGHHDLRCPGSEVG